MIYCPNCKEEIEPDSLYCDQCGTALLFCGSCGRVGLGKRCTHCGGIMGAAGFLMTTPSVVMKTPEMMLVNMGKGITIVADNGAVLGRRKGPYTKMLEDNPYVSGLHAQLIYDPDNGWGVVDKNSSNGTKVNGESLIPERFRSLKDGDTLMLANLPLQVRIT